MDKDLKVTVTRVEATSVNPSAKHTTVSITIDEQPAYLNKHGNDIKIRWKIDDPSNQGWKFTDDGIALKGDWGGKFANEGSAHGGKHYVWKRIMADNGKYEYTIRVTDGVATASWDPSIINQP